MRALPFEDRCRRLCCRDRLALRVRLVPVGWRLSDGGHRLESFASVIADIGPGPSRSDVSTKTWSGKAVHDVYDANGFHYIVAASGKPYLFEVKGSLPVSLMLSDYGSTPPVEVPAGALHLPN